MKCLNGLYRPTIATVSVAARALQEDKKEIPHKTLGLKGDILKEQMQATLCLRNDVYTCMSYRVGFQFLHTFGFSSKRIKYKGLVKPRI